MISCRDRAFFDSFSTGHYIPKLSMEILHFVQDDKVRIRILLCDRCTGGKNGYPCALETPA